MTPEKTREFSNLESNARSQRNWQPREVGSKWAKIQRSAVESRLWCIRANVCIYNRNRPKSCCIANYLATLTDVLFNPAAAFINHVNQLLSATFSTKKNHTVRLELHTRIGLRYSITLWDAPRVLLIQDVSGTTRTHSSPMQLVRHSLVLPGRICYRSAAHFDYVAPAALLRLSVKAPLERIVNIVHFTTLFAVQKGIQPKCRKPHCLGLIFRSLATLSVSKRLRKQFLQPQVVMAWPKKMYLAKDPFHFLKRLKCCRWGYSYPTLLRCVEGVLYGARVLNSRTKKSRGVITYDTEALLLALFKSPRFLGLFREGKFQRSKFIVRSKSVTQSLSNGNTKTSLWRGNFYPNRHDQVSFGKST